MWSLHTIGKVLVSLIKIFFHPPRWAILEWISWSLHEHARRNGFLAFLCFVSDLCIRSQTSQKATALTVVQSDNLGPAQAKCWEGKQKDYWWREKSLQSEVLWSLWSLPARKSSFPYLPCLWQMGHVVLYCHKTVVQIRATKLFCLLTCRPHISLLLLSVPEREPWQLWTPPSASGPCLFTTKDKHKTSSFIFTINLFPPMKKSILVVSLHPQLHLMPKQGAEQRARPSQRV